MEQPVTREAFAIPAWLDTLGAHVERHPRLWRGAARLETAMLGERLEHVRIESPVYVCGMARSGSTILLETLARHPHAATHRYRDFPALYTPWLWNRFLDRAARGQQGPVERAHGDGIAVTPDSPEAMEEVLWMGFLPHLHQPGVTDVLGPVNEFPQFEAFYRHHLRKLLWMRRGRRYLSKGNYNTTRIGYLLRVFPDARFVVPVRDPVDQVGSLLNQHRRFCEWHRRDPRARRYMRRLGHFEFGLDRRPVHTGDDDLMAAIHDAWRHGRDVEGYALSWHALYRFVADSLDADAVLRDAVLVVRHEDLCAQPGAVLERVFRHCGLPVDDALLRELAASIRPHRIHAALSAAEHAAIRRTTAITAGRFGYETRPARSARRSA